MTTRIDTASVQIRAPAAQVFRAFADPQAVAVWLPPEGMVGRMQAFDFVAGGGYRMRLTYPAAAQGAGKTSADADEVDVRFVRIVPNACIEEAVRFESDDPAYAGEMRITWLLAPEEGAGTRVTVRCEDVPAGIAAADHVAALQSTLAQLAAFVERGEGA